MDNGHCSWFFHHEVAEPLGANPRWGGRREAAADSSGLFGSFNAPCLDTR